MIDPPAGKPDDEPVHRIERLPGSPHCATTPVDETAYAGLIRRLADAGVDSITALGSTGSYAYLSCEERRTALRIAIENAGDVPVFAGIGALRTSHVRALAEDAPGPGLAQ